MEGIGHTKGALRKEGGLCEGHDGSFWGWRCSWWFRVRYSLMAGAEVGDTAAEGMAVDMAEDITEVGTMAAGSLVEDIEAAGIVARTAADIAAVITPRCITIRQAATRPATPSPARIEGPVGSPREARFPIATG
jgi:hypothetical protein